MHCYACGNLLGESARFCGRCGALVRETASCNGCAPLLRKQEWHRSLFMLLTPLMALAWNLLYQVLLKWQLTTVGVKGYVRLSSVGGIVSCVFVALWLGALTYVYIHKSRRIALRFSCLCAVCAVVVLLLKCVDLFRLRQQSGNMIEMSQQQCLIGIITKVVDVFFPFIMWMVFCALRPIINKSELVFGMLAAMVTGLMYFGRTLLDLWMYNAVLSRYVVVTSVFGVSNETLWWYVGCFAGGAALLYLLFFATHRKDRVLSANSDCFGR